MATVFAEPDYAVEYDSSVLNTFHTIASSKVNAYIDENGDTMDLTLGASSNVNLEAFEGINIYFDRDQALTVFNTIMTSNVRTDTPILKIHQDPAEHITYLQSSNAPLYLSGLDSNVTTKISQTLISASNQSQVLQTDLDNFDIRAPLYLSSNLDVSLDVVSHNNIACAGNVFSSSLNLYKNYAGSNAGSNSQVAFGFFINEHEHLELVKYHKYTVSNAVQSEMKRVATFGKMPGNGVGNLSNYAALNEFNGIVGQSNGNTPQMTSMLWGSQSGTSNVYYIAGDVGVGTSTPTERLHVKGGNLKVQGHILPDSNLTYDLGSSNLRFKDLYLSGNTINLAGATISVNESGTIEMRDQIGSEPVDISGVTSNASNALSIATEASNMAYSLASAAINSNAINFSSNTAHAASNNTFTLSNYVWGTNRTTVLWASNNLLNKNTGGNVTGILSATQIGVGQVSPTEKMEVVGNIKATSNVYVGTKLGVGTTTPSQPLHVIGNARIEGNLDVSGIFNTINTDVKVTDQFTVSNAGTGPAMKVYQNGVQPIAQFYDDDTVVVHIGDGGLVGINTTSPVYSLDVVGDINFTGSLLQNGSVFSSGSGGGGTSVWAYKSSNVYVLNSNVAIGKSNAAEKLDVVGNIVSSSNIYASNAIGIGTTTPSYALHVFGTIYATQDITAYSDVRAKSNLEVISSPLDKMEQLTGYTYDFINMSAYNDSMKTKITERFTGILAQDLEKVLPEAVHRDDAGKMSVAYGNMAGLFVESIKELKKKNAELEQKMEECMCTCASSTSSTTCCDADADAETESTTSSTSSADVQQVDDALTKLRDLVTVEASTDVLNLIINAIKELDDKVEALKPKKRTRKAATVVAPVAPVAETQETM